MAHPEGANLATGEMPITATAADATRSSSFWLVPPYLAQSEWGPGRVHGLLGGLSIKSSFIESVLEHCVLLLGRSSLPVGRRLC